MSRTIATNLTLVFLSFSLLALSFLMLKSASKADTLCCYLHTHYTRTCVPADTDVAGMGPHLRALLICVFL